MGYIYVFGPANSHVREELWKVRIKARTYTMQEVADIKIESSFVDDLGADSLDTVELVMALEDEFEMEIPDEQAEKITTVQQAIDYAKAHVKA